MELPNRDTQFEFALLRLKNRMAIRNVVNDSNYWTSKRLADFYKLLDEYLAILEDQKRLGRIVRCYQSPEIFLAGLQLPNRGEEHEKYKERLARM